MTMSWSVAGQSCLHYIQSWQSDAEHALERLNAIVFLVHVCGADVNIQVTFAYEILTSLIHVTFAFQILTIV